MTSEELTKALKRAYNLGQIYWQQADSEYTSQHKKADVTEAAFKELIETTVAALEAKDEIDWKDMYEKQKRRSEMWVAKYEKDIGPLEKAGPQQEAKDEPVTIDLATMELAESVGLIGPASRTHDLHNAIQRFHDLICANATIKAAVAFSCTLEAKDEPVQVSPLEFVGMVMEKEHLVGKPIFWAEWPSREKS